jgi:transcriptional regulator NrdR family protein
MIRVRKRSGRWEPFDRSKLAGALWRAMLPLGGRWETAGRIADAIETHLVRAERHSSSSAALMEMSLRALAGTGHIFAADAMEAYARRKRKPAGRFHVAKAS